MIRALATILAATLLTAAPATAANDGTRGCVTQHEALITPFGMDRDRLETRWEVTGLGTREYSPLVGATVYVYPACKPWGRNFHEQAWAAFDTDHRMWAVGFDKLRHDD